MRGYLKYRWKLNHERVIPGSIKATYNGESLKVKEKLKGEWLDGKLIRFIVVGYSVSGIPANICATHINVRMLLDGEI